MESSALLKRSHSIHAQANGDNVLALGVDIGGVDDGGLSVVREIAMCTHTQACGGDGLALEE